MVGPPCSGSFPIPWIKCAMDQSSVVVALCRDASFMERDWEIADQAWMTETAGSSQDTLQVSLAYAWVVRTEGDMISYGDADDGD